MATILIAVLPQLGHINPTLGIAFDLVHAGHRVMYLAGHRFHSVIESAGAFQAMADDETNPSADDRQSIEAMLGFDRCSLSDRVKRVAADVVLVDKILAEHYLKGDLSQMKKRLVFATSLLDWQDPSSLDDEEAIMVLCPELLEVPKFRYPRKRLFYVEPAVVPISVQNAMAYPEAEVSHETIRPLVVCAFGTQSVRHIRLKDHYELIISLAAKHQDCDFVLAAEHSSLLTGAEIPMLENLKVVPHFRQRELLCHAAAFITHGGLGSIKEAILAGVPMLVIPGFGDQFVNAMRVRYHGLGDGLFDGHQTVREASAILSLMLQGRFKAGMEEMQILFAARLRGHLSSVLIQEVIVGDNGW